MRRIILLLLIPGALFGQAKRIKPGKMYDAGEALFAPMFGFRAVVPEGWTGSLPRESEVFLLNSITSPAEIFVLGRVTSDLATLNKEWNQGFAMDENIKLKAKGATVASGVLSSEVIAVGAFINKSMRAYAVARCHESGPCVTCLAVMPFNQYEDVKKVVDAFMGASTLEPPSSTSMYSDFVWKDFLTNQMVTTYAFLENGSKETTVHLCANGKFSSKVTKKGILKNQNPAYKGKLSGTWTVEGVGEKGRLKLVFDKGLPTLDIELTIREEQIYAGNERYFVAISDQCK